VPVALLLDDELGVEVDEVAPPDELVAPPDELVAPPEDPLGRLAEEPLEPEPIDAIVSMYCPLAPVVLVLPVVPVAPPEGPWRHPVTVMGLLA
jgi:hypothetical protein